MDRSPLARLPLPIVGFDLAEALPCQSCRRALSLHWGASCRDLGTGGEVQSPQGSLISEKEIIAEMTSLKTPEQAAEFLQCSPKQVHAHAKSGELRYVDIGRGNKRPCRRFADLIDFAERRSRREQPCQSTSQSSRRTTTTISKCEVVDFTAMTQSGHHHGRQMCVSYCQNASRQRI